LSLGSFYWHPEVFQIEGQGVAVALTGTASQSLGTPAQHFA
jgi:hypothetical protein